MYKNRIPYFELMVFFVLIFPILFGCSTEQDFSSHSMHHAVEYLVFQVKPERVEEFISLDHQIWTQFLKEQPGFVSKEIWINDFRPGEVTSIIYWNSFEQWKSIPADSLLKTTREFDREFGAENYSLVRENHKQNRWFRVSEFSL